MDGEAGESEVNTLSIEEQDIVGGKSAHILPYGEHALLRLVAAAGSPCRPIWLSVGAGVAAGGGVGLVEYFEDDALIAGESPSYCLM